MKKRKKKCKSNHHTSTLTFQNRTTNTFKNSISIQTSKTRIFNLKKKKKKTILQTTEKKQFDLFLWLVFLFISKKSEPRNHPRKKTINTFTH